jgi:hypothetical protein
MYMLSSLAYTPLMMLLYDIVLEVMKRHGFTGRNSEHKDKNMPQDLMVHLSNILNRLFEGEIVEGTLDTAKYAVSYQSKQGKAVFEVIEK